MPKAIIPFILFLIAVLLASSCALIYNIPGISDYKIFPYRVIKNSPDSIFYFTKSESINEIGKQILTNYNTLLPNTVSLDKFIEGSKTAAFIIIRNDSILYEKYDKKYQESSIFNIFSVTKIIMTTLIGIAIDEGKIKSLDDKITDYIPELSKKEGFKSISIRHLLLHTSGLKFSDSRWSPFSSNSKYYYCHNLRKLVKRAKIEESPGHTTHYSSVNTQLLVFALERSTGTSASSYLEEKIWRKIGMQYEATWSTDNKRENAIEKGFSCLNCTAIDLARIGRLYLNKGVYMNQQVLSQSFYTEAIKRDTASGSCWDFQYNFRLSPREYNSFYSRGLYGQLVYIYPQKNIILIRIGETDLNYSPQFLEHIVFDIVDQI